MFIPWWAIGIAVAVIIWFRSDREHADHNRIDALQERMDVLENKLDELLDELEKERWEGFDEVHPKSG